MISTSPKSNCLASSVRREAKDSKIDFLWGGVSLMKERKLKLRHQVGSTLSLRSESRTPA